MSKKRIMIVEDEMIVVHSLQYALENMGFEVAAIVNSAEDVRRTVQECSPDLVLMDIQLSEEMDGIEAAKQIKDLLFSPPVIFLTAYVDNKTIERAKITEPYGYIIKPFEHRELLICIEMALYKHSMERRLHTIEQKFNTVLKSIGEGIIVTDLTGKIKFMNFLAENILGVTQAELLDAQWSDKFQYDGIMSDSADGRFMLGICPVQEVLLQGISITLPDDCLLKSKNGHAIKAAGTKVSPVIDDNGELLGAVIVLKNNVD